MKTTNDDEDDNHRFVSQFVILCRHIGPLTKTFNNNNNNNTSSINLKLKLKTMTKK